MLMWMVLTVAVAAGTQAGGAQQPAGDARAQAEQLARSGSDRAALERFQALAASNPDDIEARIWIARLHARMGNDRRAVDVYQSIVATNPRHVEALLGEGESLIRLGRYREAGDALNRAEAVAADNAAVLAAQGRLHAAAGRSALALAYYQRALTIDPAATAARAELEAIRRERAHRVELGYFLEHFNVEDTPDPQAGSGLIDVRVNEALRLSGIVQHQRKFSQSETRSGAALSWLVRPRTTLHAGVLFGGDTLIFPKTDGYGGISHTRGRATWTFDLRFAEFEEVGVQIGGAGLGIALPRNSSVWAKYYRFSTDNDVTLSDIVHSWVLGVGGHPKPQWSVGAEYTHGPDQLEMLTIDRIGEFETNTYSVFTEYLLTPMFSVRGRYDYGDRPEHVRVHRASAKLVHRF